MFPFIIWAATRTGSTALAEVLDAENEPFQNGEHPNRLGWIYDRWQRGERTSAMYDVLRSGLCLKHLPEGFSDDFNTCLADMATFRDYRHIHLVRWNELARLVSLDLAIQTDAWKREEAAYKLDAARRGEIAVRPLNIPALLENSDRVDRAWRTVRSYLGSYITIAFEDATCPEIWRRDLVLPGLQSFIGRPDREAFHEAMRTSSQDSQKLRDLLPNIDNLRRALIARGRI